MKIYNKTTKRYIIAFASVFNNMTITREIDGTYKPIVVPLYFAPGEKEYVYNLKHKNLEEVKPSITFPRMSFDFNVPEFDTARQVNKYNSFKTCAVDPSGNPYEIFGYAPYNITFNLYIHTDILDDVYELLERIQLGFRTSNTILVDHGKGIISSCPLILDLIQKEDTYDTELQDRRVIRYKLSFVFKVEYYDIPSLGMELIKKVTMPFFSLPEDVLRDTVTVYVDEDDNDTIKVIKEAHE